MTQCQPLLLFRARSLRAGVGAIVGDALDPLLDQVPPGDAWSVAFYGTALVRNDTDSKAIEFVGQQPRRQSLPPLPKWDIRHVRYIQFLEAYNHE